MSEFIPLFVPSIQGNEWRYVKESLGTAYGIGRWAGEHAGTIGKLGSLSFSRNKTIRTGGGGMILTDDPNYAKKAKYISPQIKTDKIRSVYDDIGYDFRLRNVQAAMGVAQLEDLNECPGIKKGGQPQYKQDMDRIRGLQVPETPEYAENDL
jgi:perosamine synthetase